MAKKAGNYRKNKKLVLARDGYRCTEPGCTEDRRIMMTTHHLIPTAQGGSNSVENMVTLCYYHHLLRHNAPAAQSQAA